MNAWLKRCVSNLYLNRERVISIVLSHWSCIEVGGIYKSDSKYFTFFSELLNIFVC